MGNALYFDTEYIAGSSKEVLHRGAYGEVVQVGQGVHQYLSYKHAWFVVFSTVPMDLLHVCAILRMNYTPMPPYTSISELTTCRKYEFIYMYCIIHMCECES